MATVLSRKPGGSGSGVAGVSSLAESGSPALTGAVTLSEGTGVTLTQTGQDIEIAASGSGGEELIQEIIAPGGTNEFDFTGIPATFRALKFYVVGRSDAAADFATVFGQFNGDTTAIYDRIDLFGIQGVGAGQVTQTGQTSFWAGEMTAGNDVANYPGSSLGEILFYTDTTFYQIVHARAVTLNANALETGVFGSFWQNTAVINRIRLFITSGNFVSGSRAALYGVT